MSGESNNYWALFRGISKDFRPAGSMVLVYLNKVVIIFFWAI
jgi:hypothetical protein